MLEAALWTIVAARYAFVLPKLEARATRYDFSIYYNWAVAIRRGLDPYATDLYAQGVKLGLEVPNLHQVIYPPPSLLIFGLLGYLPVHGAYWTWMTVSATAFALSLALLLDRHRLGRAAPVMVGLILLWPPVIAHLWYAQSQFLILLLLVVMAHCLWLGRDGPAGLALAAAILFKAFPAAIIGYLLAQRRWKALGWTLVCGALGVLAALPVTGFKQWSEFFASQPGAAPGVENMAVAGLIARICQHFFGMGSGTAVRPVLVSTLQVLLLVATYAATFGRDDDDGACYSLWIAAMLVAAPIVWEHYLVLLIIPIVQLAGASAHGRANRRATLAMLAACTLIFVMAPFGATLPRHSAAAILSEYGVAALVLAYLSAWWLVRARDESG